MNHWTLAALAFTPMAIVLPAHAVEYLDVAGAQHALFPAASRFDEASFTPDDAQNKAVDAALGGAQKPRRVQAWTAHDAGGKALGQIMLDEVIGKYERITYAVAFAPNGEIVGIEILAYRESHGQEIRLPAWRKQFIGKHGAESIRFGDAIKNISGATLSCRHVTEGVQRLAVLHGLTAR